MDYVTLYCICDSCNSFVELEDAAMVSYEGVDLPFNIDVVGALCRECVGQLPPSRIKADEHYDLILRAI